MTTSIGKPTALGQYLARHGFAPSPGNHAWLDRGTGQQTVRVLHEPGETTLLYCLAPRSVCLYEAVFSPGTPDAVVTAAIDAALSPPQVGRGRTRPSATAAHAQREG